MDPALIGAGLSAVTSVIGAIGSARAQRKSRSDGISSESQEPSVV